MKVPDLKIWITSDTHLGHNKILDYQQRNYGFEDAIKKNLEVIKEGDILVHLGDICIGRDEYWHDFYFKDLKCKKILVLGNHDKKSKQWYYAHGWDFVCESYTDSYYGRNLIFTHVPITKDPKYTMNIHGHLHGNYHRLGDIQAANYDHNYHYDAGVDTHSMKPTLLRTIVKA